MDGWGQLRCSGRRAGRSGLRQRDATRRERQNERTYQQQGPPGAGLRALRVRMRNATEETSARVLEAGLAGKQAGRRGEAGGEGHEQ